MRRKMMSRNYSYTLGEIIDKMLPEESRIATKKMLRLGLGVNNFLTDIVKTSFNMESIYDDVITSTEANTLVSKYVCPKYWNCYCLIRDTDDEITATDEDIQDLIATIVEVIRRGYDKYKLILDSYDNEKSHLLDAIKTVSENKFNDTPQQRSIDGYEDDEYVSSITTNTTTTDTTKMQRINELEKMYHNVYDNWSKEIGSAIVYWSER